MNQQIQKARNAEGVVALSATDSQPDAKLKPSLFELLANSPLSGSGLEIIRDRDDSAIGRSTPINSQGEAETQ